MTRFALALFDLDDTLLDHRSAVVRGIRSHVDALGSPYSDGRIDSVTLWHELEDAHYHRYLSGELTFAEQRRTRAVAFADAHGVALTDELADQWFDDYFVHYRESWTLFDDALPCLDAVAAAGAQIGVITNGDPDFQQVKLERTGLEGRFAHVVASGAVGVAKPDPAIFTATCDRFGVDPADALYIGDRLMTDAVGAARAGLTGVWLNRFGDDLPEGALGHGSGTDAAPERIVEDNGVITVSSLGELSALVSGR
ncbi:HAD family hydrolase [Paramicrobacterium agarici]|uniref:Putative hydrolase of the HAD superfamily n=1 Tax=Paramicrobacterium agarici TaxID=630514 RepID=A0A2A9DYT0_9MICO|nr:HAD-IA family hydrolase [Microbacterium agarici]PFG31967.1 putative hydrolase of the HAD superfamily [Microbacterium agarici]TQO21858.1 putative hydrolase of the HAD superfamily [Microbacterium agarici]